MEQNAEEIEVTVYRREYVPTAAWAVGNIILLIIVYVSLFISEGYVSNGLEYAILLITLIISTYVIVFTITVIYFKKGLNFFTHKLFKRERYVILIIGLLLLIEPVVFRERVDEYNFSVLSCLYGLGGLAFFVSHGYFVYHKFDWMLGFRSRRHEKNRYIYVNYIDDEEGVNVPKQ
ncbi:MAG: hypothetical protein FWE54_05845 [Methanimicrococcus sp.]|nr:hypothetical protein [Methanimicrococcus sp.]